MKIQQIKRRGKQLGLSIIELLIVLAVVAGIIAAILVRQQSIEQGQQATRVTDNVMALASAIRNVGANQSYANIDYATLTTLKMVPASLKPIPATGTTTSYSDATGTIYKFVSGASGFAISLDIGSTDLCVKIGSTLQNAPESIKGGANIGIAGGTATGDTVVKADGASALNLTNLTTACNDKSLALQFR